MLPPPQQEESIKECRCPKCKLENNHGVCDDHNCCNYNPQLKDESPKEDEYPRKDAGDIWRAVKDELEKDGFKLPIRWKSVGTAYGCFVKIQEILDKKYVSKEKIKNHLFHSIQLEGITHGESLMRGRWINVEDLLKSLGLEEL